MKEFKNELMITLAPSSWCYHLTNKQTAEEAVAEFYGVMDNAGIDTSNMTFIDADLRDITDDEYGNPRYKDIDHIKWTQW